MEQAGLQLIAQDANQFFGDMAKASRAVDTFSDTTGRAGGSVSAAGQVMIGALRKVGEIAIDVFGKALHAGAQFIGDSMSLAGDFSQTMSVLGAVSGASADEIAALSKKAKELGNDLTLPATSAVDAGNAMLELSKAGFTVEDSMDAAKGVLQLAAAAQIDEAQAAEINANALQAFGLAADKSIFVSDLLAASANASSVEITDVAQSYQMAGAVFSAFQGPVVGSKQAIIDLTTAIGILGNAGIKGSDAGTSLKQALLQLTGPSEKSKGLMEDLAKSIGVSGDIAFDANGKMRSFQEILGLTAAATKNLTDEKRNQYITDIFGADASRAILVLMKQGPDAWDAMTAAVTRQGAAADLAAAQTTGLKGAWEGAKSQIETLQLTIGQALNPVLEMLVRNYLQPAIAGVTSFVEALTSADDPVLFLAQAIDGLVPGLGSILGYIATFIQSGDAMNDFLASSPPLFQGLIGAIQTAIPVIQQIATFIGDNLQPILLGVADALQGRWAVLLPAITSVVNGIAAVVLAVFGQVQAFLGAHGAAIVAVLSAAWKTINAIINDVITILGLTIGTGLQTIAAYITAHGTEIQAFLAGAWDAIATIVTTALTLIAGIVHATLQVLQGDWSGAWTTIQQTCAQVVMGIVHLITLGLNDIASMFDTSMAGILRTWQYNWETLVEIVNKIPALVANVGSAIVDTIRSGFERAWSNFVDSAQRKLQEFRDMLPFSEPKDSSSPLYGLGKSGEAIVTMLADGLSRSTALIDAARTLTADMRDALNFQALIPRTLDSMDQFMADLRDHLTAQPIDIISAVFGTQGRDDLLRQVQAQTTEAFSQAQQLAGVDPQAAQQFLRLRTDQIQELADLQEQLLNASGPEAAAIQQRIARITEAQGFELQAFLSQIEGIGSILPQLLASVSPPATAGQIAAGGNATTVTNAPQFNLGVTTNQSPAVVQQGFLALQALYGRGT